ncbi:unnamed protein product [Moneuplotes crassus]|uniref:Uncharacterized protein n=1 Tax=Euplotes crassus TaxID=5936 RepID=A0AAD1X6X9_EUPCR|nr:unnamed protein product [Moneuplotes crassus]
MNKPLNSLTRSPNQLLNKKWDEKAYKLHVQSLKKMRPMVNTKSPPGLTYKHIKINTKRDYEVMRRYNEIEKENIRLVELAKKKYNSLCSPGRNKAKKKSLNDEFRKKQLVKITLDNFKMMKRLKNVKSSIKVEESNGILNFRSLHPKNGVKTRRYYPDHKLSSFQKLPKVNTFEQKELITDQRQRCTFMTERSKKLKTTREGFNITRESYNKTLRNKDILPSDSIPMVTKKRASSYPTREPETSDLGEYTKQKDESTTGEAEDLYSKQEEKSLPEEEKLCTDLPPVSPLSPQNHLQESEKSPKLSQNQITEKKAFKHVRKNSITKKQSYKKSATIKQIAERQIVKKHTVQGSGGALNKEKPAKLVKFQTIKQHSDLLGRENEQFKA